MPCHSNAVRKFVSSWSTLPDCPGLNPFWTPQKKEEDFSYVKMSLDGRGEFTFNSAKGTTSLAGHASENCEVGLASTSPISLISPISLTIFHFVQRAALSAHIV